jgi:hypothetical protein
MLASAIGAEGDDFSLQRLIDAVSRTGAFSQGLSWSFFEDQTPHQTPSPEPFPDNLVSDDPAIAALKGEYTPFFHIKAERHFPKSLFN